jgi:hypothetical protein
VFVLLQPFGDGAEAFFFLVAENDEAHGKNP